MHCFPCRQSGRSHEAVALCPHCLVGLCPEHRAELSTGNPGGTGLGCRHEVNHPGARPAGVAA